MKPSPNSVVSFDCTEEEAKRHEWVSGKRIIRRSKVKASKAEKNPNYDAHADRLHLKATFNFFWDTDGQNLQDLATATDDREFCQSMATFAGHLIIVCCGIGGYGLGRPSSKDLQKSVNIILDLRKTYHDEVNFKKFLNLDDEEEDTFDPENWYAAPLLRNFRRTKTFTDMIMGLQRDKAIPIEKVSPELRKLRELSNETMGDMFFANLYPNHRTGTTSSAADGTSTGADSDSTRHPESDSTEHHDENKKRDTTRVARKKPAKKAKK